MEYNKIIAVTGLSGLFELVTSKADGAVVRSLEDNSTKFVSSRVHNFSHLESIEIFSVKENSNLAELFHAMRNSKEPIPNSDKDGASLKSYFEIVFPDMDFERVYASDMKKIIRWYHILESNTIEIPVQKEDEKELEDEKEEKPVPQEESLKNSK